MSAARLVLSWVPSLVVGLTLATAAEVSAALLLYSGRGFLRALSLILAVEAGSVAMGLWMGRSVRGPRVVESIRRRWLLALVALAAAAVTSGVWSILEGFSGSRLGQGLGLAVLGGLPLYALGSLAGLLGRPQAGLEPPSGGPWPGPAVLVVAGAGSGFLLTGVFLLPRLPPASILLTCIVILSVGALVHSPLLRSVPAIRTVEERRTYGGVLRVEDRAVARGGRRVRILWANGRMRGAETGRGDPVLGDEIRVLAVVREMERAPERILVLGHGAGTLVRKVARLYPSVRVDALEETSELLSLARRHFPELPREARERTRILVADPRSAGIRELGPYDLVIADALAMDRGRPVPLLSSSEVGDLHELLVEGGTLVIFGLPGREEAREPREALLETVKERFPDAELRWGAPEEGLERLALEEPGGVILVAARGPGNARKGSDGSFRGER